MTRPNVLLILADDLGYSDVGCFGGEIRTPNIDALGREGVRLSQFYNTARCSPSRASLLTGLHPHQTGIGILCKDDRPRGYEGSLNDRCLTLAEVLGSSGYRTYLSGKWHLAAEVYEPNDSWPTRRGFENFYGMVTSCGSYFRPATLMRGEESAEADTEDPQFYFTHAISDQAEAFLRQHTQADGEDPFFMYVAYTAPHWPLHALEPDIEDYEGAYDQGWDNLRENRLVGLKAEKILPENSTLSRRDPAQPEWQSAPHKAWEIRRMQVYAAQVQAMDRGIGQILRTLEETGQRENTIVIFLSDNGASAETLPNTTAEAFKDRPDIFPRNTRDGREVHLGNTPTLFPGAEDSYSSYGQAWANVSNTPHRLYKRWLHEGGISTPFIVHWPEGSLATGLISHEPFQLTDIMPTILEATGASYPEAYPGRDLLPLQGRSMLPALKGEPVDDVPLFWEHIGNAAVRRGNWKLVREYGEPWELYDIGADRGEENDHSAQNPELAAELLELWQDWAERVGVIPFDVTAQIYADRGLGQEEARS